MHLGVKVIAAGMGVVVAALLARHLGPSAYGSFTTAVGLVAVAQAITEFGTGVVAVREMISHPQQRAVIAGGLLAARALSSIVVFVPLVAGLLIVLPSGAPTIAGLLVGVTLLLAAFSAVASVAQADLRPEIAGALLLCQSGVWLAAVVLVVLLDGGLVALAAALVATTAFQSVVTIWVMRRYVRVSFVGWRVQARRILRIAIPMGLAGVLTTTYYRVDSAFVYSLAGAEDAGFYNAAYRFLDVAQMLPSTLFFVLFPLVSARRRAGEDFARLVSLAATMMVAVALPVTVAGAVFSGPVIRLIYSESFDDAATLLSVLSLAFVGICLGYLWSSLLLSDGPLRIFVVVAALAAAGSIVANLIFIPPFGALGAAWVTVGTEAFVATALGIAACRRAAFTAPLSRWLRCLASAGVMLATALAIAPFSLWLAFPASLVAYAAALLGLRAVRLVEITALMRREPTALGD